MAQKKSKLTIKKIKKDKRFKKTLPALLLLLGVVIGSTLVWLQPPNLHPKNLVWATDPTVKIPSDLVEFLRNDKGCEHDSSHNPLHGVGLWGVYQVSQNKFAKVSYGCSTSLTTYIMAVKDGGSWRLLQPTEYFASQSTASRFLPNCSFIDKYKIDSSIEPFCIEVDGTPRENKFK